MQIRKEIQSARSCFLPLFTQSSHEEDLVRHEIGMADTLRIRIVCVFYKVTIADFDPKEDGAGPLDGLSIIELNNLGTYLDALRKRVKKRD